MGKKAAASATQLPEPASYQGRTRCAPAQGGRDHRRHPAHEPAARPQACLGQFRSWSKDLHTV